MKKIKEYVLWSFENEFSYNTLYIRDIKIYNDGSLIVDYTFEVEKALKFTIIRANNMQRYLNTYPNKYYFRRLGVRL